MKLFVVGGDGANWIHRGAEEFGNAVFQLDGFLGSAFEAMAQNGRLSMMRYAQARVGRHGLMSCHAFAEISTASRDREYVESAIPLDCRNRIPTLRQTSESGDDGVQRRLS